jgi:hypothetical protein
MPGGNEFNTTHQGMPWENSPQAIQKQPQAEAVVQVPAVQDQEVQVPVAKDTTEQDPAGKTMSAEPGPTSQTKNSSLTGPSKSHDDLKYLHGTSVSSHWPLTGQTVTPVSKGGEETYRRHSPSTSTPRHVRFGHFISVLFFICFSFSKFVTVLFFISFSFSNFYLFCFYGFQFSFVFL